MSSGPASSASDTAVGGRTVLTLVAVVAPISDVK